MRGVRICSNVKILLSLGVALDTLMSYANHEESEEVIFSSWILLRTCKGDLHYVWRFWPLMRRKQLFLLLWFLANVVPANNEPAKVMGKAVFVVVLIHLDCDFRTRWWIRNVRTGTTHAALEPAPNCFNQTTVKLLRIYQAKRNDYKKKFCRKWWARVKKGLQVRGSYPLN